MIEAIASCYERVVENFERELSGFSQTTTATLIADRAPWPEAEQAFTAMAGAHGLMIVARSGSGAEASLAGTPKHCKLYLVGNPLIAKRLFDIDTCTSLYFPLRVSIFARALTECTYIAYDRPSSVLGRRDATELGDIGRELDRRLAGVVAALRTCS